MKAIVSPNSVLVVFGIGLLTLPSCSTRSTTASPAALQDLRMEVVEFAPRTSASPVPRSGGTGSRFGESHAGGSTIDGSSGAWSGHSVTKTGMNAQNAEPGAQQPEGAEPGAQQPEGAEPDAQKGEGAEPMPHPTFEEQLEDIWTRDKLTGDWRGWRTDLVDHGIDAQVRLTQFGQWVAAGGVETGGEYGGTVDYRVNADMRKLFGFWEGLSVVFHARSRFGEDVNSKVGNLVLQNTGLLSPAPGDFSGTEVTGLTASQFLPFDDERLLNITIGKLDVVDTVNGFFPNLGYGQEGFWNINSLVTTLPWVGAVTGLSLWGAIVSTVNKEYQAAETGVLVTGTKNESTSWDGISSSFDDGVWLAAYHRFFWKLENMPGNLLIFVGGSTREQASNEPNDIITIPGQGIVDTDEEYPWDVAAYLTQTVWQGEKDTSRRVVVTAGGTAGPDNPQFVQFHAFANVEAFGVFDSRPHDRMGIAAWKNWFSDDFRDLVSPVANLRDFYGFEFYYNFEVNKWLHITPDLQLVMNEWQGDNLATVLGVRGVVDF